MCNECVGVGAPPHTDESVCRKKIYRGTVDWNGRVCKSCGKQLKLARRPRRLKKIQHKLTRIPLDWNKTYQETSMVCPEWVHRLSYTTRLSLPSKGKTPQTDSTWAWSAGFGNWTGELDVTGAVFFNFVSNSGHWTQWTHSRSAITVATLSFRNSAFFVICVTIESSLFFFQTFNVGRDLLL